MKNRYCLFCGTLLPENGVCLRCGAKYELADDGQLKVIPRKVKKVSVKATPKKKFMAKKASDPSEAETQTIHLPEDIFSDDFKQEERHQDWTGNSKAEESRPNAARYDNPLKQQTSETSKRATVGAGDESPTDTKRTGVLWAIFIGIALLVAALTFFVLHDRIPEEKDGGIPGRTIQIQQGNKANDFSVNYSEPADATAYFNNLCITDENGNEKVRYKYDSENKKLSIFTITGEYSNDEYWLDLGLLPLISPEKRNNNLLLSSFVRHKDMGNTALSDDSLEILFALSDYIRSGAIKSLDYDGTDYSFEVDLPAHILKSIINENGYGGDDGFVNKSVLTYENNYLTRVRFNYGPDAYYERVMTYNDDGLLSQYRYKWYEKFKNEEESGPKVMKTEDAWVYNYSDDGLLKNAVGSLEDMVHHVDYAFNTVSQLMRMEEHLDSDNNSNYIISHNFSYNEKGQLTRLVKDTGDEELDPTANFEYATPLSESTIPWRLEYQKHLRELIKDRDILNFGQITDFKFAFLKLYNNPVPALFIWGGLLSECHVCYYNGDKLNTEYTTMDYYREGGDVIIAHGGRMDNYNTSVIGLRNGSWKTLFEGRFHADPRREGIFDGFWIEEKSVTREQYNEALNSFMSFETSSSPMKALNYDRLLSFEECMDALSSGSIAFYSGDTIDKSLVLIPSTYDEWMENRE